MKFNAHRFLKFACAGGVAFVVDAGLLWVLVQAGVPPLAARVASIGCAMVVAWWLNRSLTFTMAKRPSWQEFMAYASLAAGVALLNYAVFSVLIISGLVSWPPAAAAVATVLAMGVSYAGMAGAVFRQRP